MNISNPMPPGWKPPLPAGPPPNADETMVDAEEGAGKDQTTEMESGKESKKENVEEENEKVDGEKDETETAKGKRQDRDG